MTNERLEQIAWAFFLIVVGGLALLPDRYEPAGAWGFSVGLIMLGLNLARYFYGIKMSNFTLVVGSLFLLSGLSDYLGYDLPLFPIVLIGAGIVMIYRGMVSREEEEPGEKPAPQM